MKIDLLLLSEKRREVYKFYKLDFLEDGTPVKNTDIGLIFHPILAPYLIIDFLKVYEDTNNIDALKSAKHIAMKSFNKAEKFEDGLVFWYHPEEKLSSFPMKFYSGLTQSWYIKASAHLSKYDKAFQKTTQLFFNSLLIPIESGGVLLKKEYGWVIEEYPFEPPLYTLNGWLTVIRWLIEEKEYLNNIAGYYPFIEKNLDAVKYLLPLYDAGFCSNSRYQLTGFSRFRFVFPEGIKFKLSKFSINIPNEGTYTGAMEKGSLSRWKNYMERDEGRLLQLNIVMSLSSFPNNNLLISSISVTEDCTARCFLAEGEYDPHSTGMPTKSWRELPPAVFKKGENNVKIDLKYDDVNMFAYPTNFKKDIYQGKGKKYNAYHFVHIADLAVLYAFSKDSFYKYYCLKWIDYMNDWPNLTYLDPEKYSHQHYLGEKYMKNIYKILNSVKDVKNENM